MRRVLIESNSTAQILQTCIRVFDISLVLFLAWFIFFVKTGFSIEKHYYLLIIIGVISMQFAFNEFNIYRYLFDRSIYRHVSNVFVAWSSVCIFLVLVLFFSKTAEMVSRVWLASWYVLSLLSVCIVHIFFRAHFRAGRKARGNKKQTVIIFGASRMARKIIQEMLDSRFSRYEVVAAYDNNQRTLEKYFSDAPIKGSFDDGIEFVKNNKDHDELAKSEIWAFLPLRRNKYLQRLLGTCQDATYSVRFIPSLSGINLLNSNVDYVCDHAVFTLIDNPINGSGVMSKYLQDKILSAIFLLIAAPFMLFVGLLIKLESPGPVFFKQTRYGADGRRIKVWKFRSMTTCEDNVVKQASADDIRVTRVGRIIRRYSIDELPQLFNVLLGDMSIVGPRPHAVNHNEEYRKKISGYMLRHKLKPGITGWAQVNGWRGETDVLDKMQKRIEHDLFYLRNWSTLLDIKIIFMTVLTIFIGKNAY